MIPTVVNTATAEQNIKMPETIVSTPWRALNSAATFSRENNAKAIASKHTPKTSIMEAA